MIDPADFRAVCRAVMEVIAEKTKFPVTCLALHHRFDDDLCVDSMTVHEILNCLAGIFPARPVSSIRRASVIRDLARQYYTGPHGVADMPVAHLFDAPGTAVGGGPTPSHEAEAWPGEPNSGPPTERLPPHPETIILSGRGSVTSRLPRLDPPATDCPP